MGEWLATARPVSGAANGPAAAALSAAGGSATAPPPPPPSDCVAALLVAYLREAEVLYTKGGRPTSHLHNVKDALRMLGDLHGRDLVAAFRPLKLKAARETSVARGLGRSTVNKHVGTIKRAFKGGRRTNWCRRPYSTPCRPSPGCDGGARVRKSTHRSGRSRPNTSRPSCPTCPSRSPR